MRNVFIAVAAICVAACSSKPVTLSGDVFIVTRGGQNYGEDRLVSTITRADVEAFRAAQVGTITRERVVSNATINRIMGAMAAFGTWCLVSGRQYHTSNPWAKHPPLPEDGREIPELTEAQIERIFAALEDQAGPLPSHGRRKNRAPWRQIFEFSRETGLRKGELEKLRRSDVSTKARLITITSRRATGFTKSRKPRVIPLSPLALEVLEQIPVRLDG
jgi:integrase